jgi:hypothetical protein
MSGTASALRFGVGKRGVGARISDAAADERRSQGGQTEARGATGNQDHEDRQRHVGVGVDGIALTIHDVRSWIRLLENVDRKCQADTHAQTDQDAAPAQHRALAVGYVREILLITLAGDFALALAVVVRGLLESQAVVLKVGSGSLLGHVQSIMRCMGLSAK